MLGVEGAGITVAGGRRSEILWISRLITRPSPF
jgi:hypothetical protein